MLENTVQHWYTPDEIDAVMQSYDTDGSQDLDLQEFKNLVSQ